jgi:Sir2 family
MLSITVMNIRTSVMLIYLRLQLYDANRLPDFRSENGIYQLVQMLDLDLDYPEDLFDLEAFQNNPAPFFKFARALYPGEHAPSPTHKFLKLLEDNGKLQRVYTQNIDGLEQQAGLKRTIACHGSFVSATCLDCSKKFAAEDIKVSKLLCSLHPALLAASVFLRCSGRLLAMHRCFASSQITGYAFAFVVLH